ncbi:MAG: BTAD domain-containing putative transcriptional regulator, partial [Ornithinimicrobium sp.]
AGAGLGSDLVQRRSDSYRLQIEGATLDAEQFEQRVQRDTRELRRRPEDIGYEQASATLELYTGDLLPEAGYAEWVLSERDRLRLVAAGFAVEVAQWCLRSARHTSGIEAARRALELDQYQDSAWTVLTQLQEGSGDFTAAAVTRAKHADVRERMAVRPRLSQDARAVPEPWHR